MLAGAAQVIFAKQTAAKAEDLGAGICAGGLRCPCAALARCNVPAAFAVVSFYFCCHVNFFYICCPCWRLVVLLPSRCPRCPWCSCCRLGALVVRLALAVFAARAVHPIVGRGAVLVVILVGLLVAALGGALWWCVPLASILFLFENVDSRNRLLLIVPYIAATNQPQGLHTSTAECTDKTC